MVKESVKRWLQKSAPALDVALAPISAGALAWLSMARRLGNARLPVHRSLYRRLGVFPLLDHYYEPLFNTDRLKAPSPEGRVLPGIDWNVQGQLNLLQQFHWQNELRAFPTTPALPPQFSYDNGSFGPGDAEFLYSMIRKFKPRRIVEIGSGHSTLMAVAAVAANHREDASLACDHVCIEPFECPWLEGLPIRLVRQLVETVDPSVFTNLAEGDILFIDSSHVIRPQGDVLFEILEVLPQLHKGVLIHIHDVFSPRDYPRSWLANEGRLWNEQYLLEAFLSHNREFRILAALNFLHRRHRDALARACPVLAQSHADIEPASFWLAKT